jgi:excisionase family DNA binding protein
MVAFKSAKKHAMNHPKPAPAAEESQYCSTRAAADLLGISIKTAQSWVEAGMLRAWKTPGGHRRILRTSVESLLRERKGLLTRPAVRSAAFTILAVDDDPEMRQLYEMHLGEWDTRTRLLTANNGFEALLRIGQEAPRVLIADLNMPGMDGFRMVHTLRANPDHAALNIIIVSALSAAEIDDQGGLPADIPVFTKPVAFEKLKQRLSGIIS